MKRSASAAELDDARDAAPELDERDKWCPICLEDWDVNATNTFRSCCCKFICTPCNEKLGNLPCPLCRVPRTKSDEEALAMLRRHVENDNPAAVYILGECYTYGQLGLDQSHEEAARLFQRGVELGDVMAMSDLGYAYERGEGVKLDKKKAVEYYRMAADRGHAIARFNMGVLFRNGDGVAQDYAEAVRFYKLAADQGLTSAEYNLGNMYEFGHGVARDVAAAIRWYERAAAKGYEDAKTALTKLRAAEPEPS